MLLDCLNLGIINFQGKRTMQVFLKTSFVKQLAHLQEYTFDTHKDAIYLNELLVTLSIEFLL